MQRWVSLTSKMVRIHFAQVCKCAVRSWTFFQFTYLFDLHLCMWSTQTNEHKIKLHRGGVNKQPHKYSICWKRWLKPPIVWCRSWIPIIFMISSWDIFILRKSAPIKLLVGAHKHYGYYKYVQWSVSFPLRGQYHEVSSLMFLAFHHIWDEYGLTVIQQKKLPF